MPNIVGVWENYKLYLDRGEHLPDWHRVVPSFFTFDDHEIVNDVYGAGEVGLRNRRPVFRDIALKAWYDYLGWSNPVDPSRDILFGRAAFTAGSPILTDPEADFSQLDPREAATLHVHWGTPDAGVMDGPSDHEGGHPNAGVYRIVEVLDANRLKIRPAARADGKAAYSIGRVSHFRKSISNADFFFLDTRSHRMMHEVSQPWKKGLSMIGAPQKDWLKREMKASQADLFFVVSSVNFTIPHVGAMGPDPIPNKDEAWTVFMEEREELIRFWDSLGKPVFVLTGDLHNSFAIKITGRVWEFASGPHNSTNTPAEQRGRAPHQRPLRFSRTPGGDTLVQLHATGHPAPPAKPPDLLRSASQQRLQQPGGGRNRSLGGLPPAPGDLSILRRAYRRAALCRIHPGRLSGRGSLAGEVGG